MTNAQKHISKFISLILRHNPKKFNFNIEYNGAWANTQDLIDLMKNNGKNVSMQDLEIVVLEDSKGRYSFNDDKTKIRANQGHSIDVDLGFKPLEKNELPTWLYHGTNSRFVDSILEIGLKPMSRQYVHLSDNIETALQVGDRRKKDNTETHIFKISTIEAINQGIEFYKSENGVYLANFIPSKLLR